LTRRLKFVFLFFAPLSVPPGPVRCSNCAFAFLSSQVHPSRFGRIALYFSLPSNPNFLSFPHFLRWSVPFFQLMDPQFFFADPTGPKSWPFAATLSRLGDFFFPLFCCDFDTWPPLLVTTSPQRCRFFAGGRQLLFRLCYFSKQHSFFFFSLPHAFTLSLFFFFFFGLFFFPLISEVRSTS